MLKYIERVKSNRNNKVIIFVIMAIVAVLLILLFSYLKAHMKGTVSSACWVKAIGPAYDYPDADSYQAALKEQVGGASASDFIIDIDANMIPVKQGASTQDCDPDRYGTADAHGADADWCNYDLSKWCNAVTISQRAYYNYKNDPIGSPIMEDDIQGYFVYIPRYAYQVMRYSALNNTPVDFQAFNIAFQNKTDPKYIPHDEGQHSSSYDYRTGWDDEWDRAPNLCNQSSNSLPDPQYKDESCWATHPAFTFGKTELNGIWVGKFETSGGTAVLPNQYSYINEDVGVLFSASINMSQNPDGAAGGNDRIAKNAGRNDHDLSNKTQSRMAKNSDWGAVAYLATSDYGRWGAAGGNEVWINSSLERDATGCAGDSVSAEMSYSCNKYDTNTGVHASTTDNIYGIYDMAGGTTELTLSNRGAIANTNFMATMPQTRYMNIYYVGPFKIRPSRSASSNESFYNFDVCDFKLCGGQANYETTTVQSVSSYSESWAADSSRFVDSNMWQLRGGHYAAEDSAGLFASIEGSDGEGFTGLTLPFAFRAVLSEF